MNAPRLSVVIVNHNDGRFLAAAIDSALAQRHPSFEVIVVDDGSTDDSAAVLARYADRVVTVRKPSGGQASAINDGFARARGRYLVFLDASDLLLPTAAVRVESALAIPGIVKVHWPQIVIDAAGNRTGKLRPSGRLAAGDLRAAALRDGPTGHRGAPLSGNGFHRDFLRRVLPMDEPLFRRGADAFLVELAPFFGAIIRVDEPQGMLRLHDGDRHDRTTLKHKLARQLRVHDHCCEWLHSHLTFEGVRIDRERWRRGSWWRRLARAIAELESLPGSAPMIVADGGTWEPGDIGDRPRLPFTEHAGAYAGPPADDRHAIDELERLRSAGAETLAFAWPTFSWLERFTGLQRHLVQRYRCVLRNDRLVAFDLRARSERSGLTALETLA